MTVSCVITMPWPIPSTAYEQCSVWASSAYAPSKIWHLVGQLECTAKVTKRLPERQLPVAPGKTHWRNITAPWPGEHRGGSPWAHGLGHGFHFGYYHYGLLHENRSRKNALGLRTWTKALPGHISPLSHFTAAGLLKERDFCELWGRLRVSAMAIWMHHGVINCG